MIEILLVKDNNNDCIELINKINSLNKNSRIYKIVSSLESCLSIIKNTKIDIIIIDFNIFKSINIIDFFYINTKIKYIILLTDDNLTIENNKFVISTLDKLLENLKKILIIRNKKKYNEKNIKNIIVNELKYLGYNFSYNGTKYLAECICYAYINFGIYDEKSIVKTYPIIAEKYNKTINNIKCNITHATRLMFCECEENKLNKYLGTCSFPKTGSKIIIETIFTKLNNL